MEEKSTIRVILYIIFGGLVIAEFILINKSESWVHLAGLGISSFILALVCMDHMTYKAHKTLKEAVDERKKKIEELAKNKEADKEELKKEEEELEKLPLADRIASIFPEPVGVLDRHEIRRALVISLTIVYMILLFKEASIGAGSIAEHFTWIYLSIIAFYFGSRGMEKYFELRKKPDADTDTDKDN
jgi:hypothetical protein